MADATTSAHRSTARTADPPFAPTAPHLVALAACIGASLLLLWPLLQGRILFGGGSSDMFIAGYSFRKFGAETFLATGSIPQWNPYLFGGLPYIGAMHGDIFYPTASLRWIMPVDLAITWGMAVHFVLAGWFTYRFVSALGVSWMAACFAGIAYELTGIVASQMSPGHDGKLFVSALTPLTFWTLLVAIRGQRSWAWGVFAFEVALVVLGHYHMAYFLLLALGLWTLWLALWDTERPQGVPAWRPIVYATGAVVVGVGITALQLLPFFAYIPFSPRASGGPDTGWAFATTYAFPPAEVFTLLLPEFNGVLDHYWGSNPIKLHTEYVGVLPLALAALALGDVRRRRLVLALGVGVLVFLMFSFGGHTPFYRPFFELLPMLKKIRAMGMVFYLPAFLLCVLAAIGLDRVLSRAVRVKTVAFIGGAFVVFAAIGAVGGLQGLASSLAIPQRLDAVDTNADALRTGALRLLGFAVLSGALLVITAARRIRARAAGLALIGVVAIDAWSVDRQFYNWSARASELFADDAVTSYLRKVPKPYRVNDPAQLYGHALLMAYDVPVVTGYHGFQLRAYNELAGIENGFRNLLSPNLLDVMASRFLLLPDTQAVPGYHVVVGKTNTTFDTPAVLYEADATPAWARVVPRVGRVPSDQQVATLVDSRFDPARIAILDDTAKSTVPEVTTAPFPAPLARATVADWAPGRMKIAIAGGEPAPAMLVVSENWYPDWHAQVDGRATPTRRVDHSLIGVEMPAGARTVQLTFASPEYARGKWISLVALLAAATMAVVPALRARGHRTDAGGTGRLVSRSEAP